MNYGTFIDDILVTLGMTHDDSLWAKDNILQNAIYQENLLVTQDLARDLGVAGDGLSATHKSRMVVVPVTYNPAPSDSAWEYLYFDLPSEVYDLPFDSGLQMISYHRPTLPISCPPSLAGAKFTQTTFGSLTGLYGSAYQKPKESQPYYVRYKSGNADRVAIFGMSPLIQNLLIQVYYAPRFADVSFGDEMRIDEHRMADLKRLVLDMSVWPLQIPQERVRNDGRDLEPNQVVRASKLISINDPILNSNIQQ